MAAFTAAASPLSTPAAVSSSVSLAVTFAVTIAAWVSTTRLTLFSYGYGYLYGSGYGNSYFNGYGYFNRHGYFNGYGNGNGYGYGSGAGNPVSISNGLTGGFVPDPVGADLPPLIIPKNCWVRRPAYDSSGANFGQVLVNLCRPSDSVTVTGSRAGPKMPGTGPGTAQPSPMHQPGSPNLPQ